MVSATASSVTPAQALSLVLARAGNPQVPLAWYRDGGIVIVSTQMRVLQHREALAQLARDVAQPDGATQPATDGADQYAPAGSDPASSIWADQPPKAGLDPTAAIPSARPAPATPAAAQRLATVTLAPPASLQARPGKPPTMYSFDQTPLREVVEYFRESMGANMFVNWGSLGALGVTQDTPVSLQLAGVSPPRALDLVLAQLTASDDPYEQVWWVQDRGVITIASGQVLDGQMRVQVVDVTDLVTVAPAYSFDEFEDEEAGGSSDSSSSESGSSSSSSSSSYSSSSSLSSSSGDSEDGDEGSRTGLMNRSGESLVQMVKDSIGSRMWEPEGKGSIRLHQNKLIISQSLLGFKMLQNSTRR